MKLLCALLVTLVCHASARAESAQQILDHARAAQRHDRSVQQVRMVLVSKNGAERVREFELKIRRDDDAIRSYARFTHPTDVSGTQLVMVDHPDRADDQLLYLPALHRVTRIAGKARTGSFMGSDFSYEDLELDESRGSSSTLVREDEKSWVIDAVPGEGSSYARIRLTVSKVDHLPRRTEFFDSKGELLKVLEVLETAQEGSTVLPTHSVMTNVRKGTSTRLEVTSWQLDIPLEAIPDDTFTAAYMENNG